MWRLAAWHRWRVDCKVVGAESVASIMLRLLYPREHFSFYYLIEKIMKHLWDFLRERGKAVLEEAGLFLSVDWESQLIGTNVATSILSKVVVSTQQSSLLVYDVTAMENPLCTHLS